VGPSKHIENAHWGATYGGLEPKRKRYKRTLKKKSPKKKRDPRVVMLEEFVCPKRYKSKEVFRGRG